MEGENVSKVRKGRSLLMKRNYL